MSIYLLLEISYERIDMVRRSNIEKQLYDAIKDGIRPSVSELEAIVGGESVSRSQSRAVDFVFPDDAERDEF
ncbi:hypothetical protein [Rhodococcus pyridinivorans]|uniref:hypothetical protein n=1 Tax=Rhodococcus pyridinivorans TaxID=103816 RepID=UPI002284BBC1|nr:hypothetical protein [Rhodococcus pyridinivorans]WAL49834.1 hypothetical protein OQN32_28040 [Rhodococcus pyridinivorans]